MREMVAVSENLVVVLNDCAIGTQFLGHGRCIVESTARFLPGVDRCSRHGDSQRQ